MEKFFANVSKPKKDAGAEIQDSDAPEKKALPKGVVLGKDGKPCRSCTSFASWAAMTKQQTTPSSSPSVSTATYPSEPPPDCPPDVDTLGRSTWTFLHTLSASYPPTATPTEQSEMSQFLSLFSKLYPCWVCAEDFRDWMRKPGNGPKVEGREGLGKWVCEAHNEVNRKLGKKEFDCGRWEERWRTGWRDGSCD